MDQREIIDQLDQNRKVFRDLLEEVPEEVRRWKPESDSWSLLEIVCHLYDEEREDFRQRTRHALEGRKGSPPPIDPPAWVIEREYDRQDYDAKLSDVLEERRRSIRWLHSLDKPDWNRGFEHPHFGTLSAGRMLSNWLAHDLLHFRQITRTKYRYLQRNSGKLLDYAGDW